MPNPAHYLLVGLFIVGLLIGAFVQNFCTYKPVPAYLLNFCQSMMDNNLGCDCFWMPKCAACRCCRCRKRIPESDGGSHTRMAMVSRKKLQWNRSGKFGSETKWGGASRWKTFTFIGFVNWDRFGLIIESYNFQPRKLPGFEGCWDIQSLRSCSSSSRPPGDRLILWWAEAKRVVSRSNKYSCSRRSGLKQLFSTATRQQIQSSVRPEKVLCLFSTYSSRCWGKFLGPWFDMKV